MKLPATNTNLSQEAIKRQTNFGATAPQFDIAKVTKKIVDNNANNLVTRVTDDILHYAADSGKPVENFLRKEGETLLPVRTNKLQDLFQGFKDLLLIPRGFASSVVESIYKKTGILENVYKNENGFVQKHIKYTEAKNNIAALKGVYENGETILQGLQDKSSKVINEKDTNANEKLGGWLNKLLNESMGFGKSQTDTKYERFWVRIVSGFTAATFLRKDFYNKATMKDKSEAEATQDSRRKLSQEIVANSGEAVTQFLFLATFAKLANTKKWVSPVVGAGIGLAFNVISRLVTGMPLSKIKVEDKPKSTTMPDNLPKVFEKFSEQKQPELNVANNVKKPMLSLKNILIMCGSIIAAGFTLRAGKSGFLKTQMSKDLAKTIENSSLGKNINKAKNFIQKKTIEDVKIGLEEAETIKNVLKSIKERKLGETITNTVKKEIATTGVKEAILGKEYIKTKGLIEVQKYKLYELPLVPFKFVKTVVTFPYAKAKSLAEALGWIKKTQAQKVITDDFDIKNVVIKYRELSKKYTKEEDLLKELDKCIKKMRGISVNNTTVSKIENEKLTVMAQILGMLTGIGFNMNDDYNKTINLGGTKQEAQKDSRLRGINKFIRVSVQAIVAGTLNGIFVKQYNSSLLKAALVTVAATIGTDTTCRFLTGMPFKKMSKEEQLAYKEKQQKGLAGIYFKFVDKLAS